MSVIQGIGAGAGYLWSNEGNRVAIAQRTRQMQPASTRQASSSFRESALAAAQSPYAQYGSMAGPAGLAMAQGAMAAGGGFGATVLGAASGLGQFALVAGVGMGANYLSHSAAKWATHQIAGAFGAKPVTTSGNKPVCVGDKVYHARSFLSSVGSLLGLAAGIFVGGFVIVATGGLAAATFGVMLGAAAAGGAAGGLIAGICDAASEYGKEKGKIIEGSSDVFFENRPVARVGDLIACEDHAAPHYVAEGAKTVFANGLPIARIGHKTTCDGNVDGGCHSIIETEQTSAEISLPAQSSIPLWLREAETYVPLFLTVAGTLKGALGLKNSGGAKACNRCTGSEPVDMASGDFVQQWQLIALDGVLPLHLTRSYFSTLKTAGLLGQNWFSDWSQWLEVIEGEIIYHDAEGGAYHYPLLPHYFGDQIYAQNAQLKSHILFGEKEGALYLFNRETQQTLTFSTLSKESDAATLTTAATALSTRRYLQAISDRFGNRIDFIYDDEQRLSTLTHSDGYHVRLSYQQEHLAHIDYVDEHQCLRLVSCEFNPQGQLIACHSHQFGSVYHAYNQRGEMTEWRDTQATRAAVCYDSRGRVIAIETVGGYYADHFEYDDEKRQTRYFDAEGGVTVYQWNADKLVTQITDPLGRVTCTEWQHQEKRAEIDALGRRTEFDYDKDYGELTRIRLASGECYTYQYDEQGQLLTTQLPDGKTWHYAYGERGELTSITSPTQLTKRYRYDENGRLTREDFADGTYQSYGYDPHIRRFISYRNVRGDKTRITCDLFGRITQLILPDQSQYHYEYSRGHANPSGSLTKLTTPEGNIQTFKYNSERLLQESQDANGNTTKYTYDAFDLLKSRTLPNGEKLTFHYDKLTRLTAVKNSQGDSYCYQYDQAGQLIKETDFTGRARHYAYDPVGRLTCQLQADGTLETFHYNALDQLIQRQTWQPAKGSAPTQTEISEKTFEKLTALLGSNAEESVEIENRLTENGYQLAHQVAYVYNKRHRLEKATNHQYLPFAAIHQTEFEYDEQDRLIAEIQDGERIEVELDKYGRQIQLTLPKGKAEQPNNQADLQSAVRIWQVFDRYGELSQ
ncbi:PAAR domain-containing protein, partial [Pasteurellaceae bacterium LIM206]|nr:PAAR domain-containing protein [Pasteurellaceae bacterium LIM206]